MDFPSHLLLLTLVLLQGVIYSNVVTGASVGNPDKDPLDGHVNKNGAMRETPRFKRHGDYLDYYDMDCPGGVSGFTVHELLNVAHDRLQIVHTYYMSSL